MYSAHHISGHTVDDHERQDRERTKVDYFHGNQNQPITTGPTSNNFNYNGNGNGASAHPSSPAAGLPGDSQFAYTNPPPPTYWTPVATLGQGQGQGQSSSLNENYSAYEQPTPEQLKIQQNILEFSRKSVRLAFTRKVFGILMLQLLITAGIIAIFVFHKGINDWTSENIGFVFGAGAVALVLTILTYCADSVRRRSPQNLILLVLITIVYGILAGSICAYFSTEAVLYGAGITIIVCLTLALFSLQSRFNFTMLSGFLVSFVVLAITCGILIALQQSEVIDIEILHLTFACLGALLLALILLFDMRRIIGGSHTYSISPEEYILAAIAIYTDVLIIFIFIVIMIGASSGGGNNDCKCSGGGGHGGYYGGIHCCYCCYPAPITTAGDHEGERSRPNGDEQL